MRPRPDAVGWCHSCEIWQRGRHARWLPMPWDGNRHDWSCVRCEDEPWGLGVWTCGCSRHEGDSEDLEHGIDSCQWEEWHPTFEACADQLCKSYPGMCTRHGRGS
jgi:hypothetical protein